MNEGDLAKLLNELQQGKLSNAEAYAAVHAFGKAGFFKARPVIEQLLVSADPELRYIALEVLVQHWRLPEHGETARDFLEHDPSSDCRIMGASALKALKQDSQDAPALRVLARIVLDVHELASVRQAAYAAMRGIAHYDRLEQYRLAVRDMDLARDIDWQFVRARA